MATEKQLEAQGRPPEEEGSTKPGAVPGRIVRRERLLHQLATQGRDAGISLVCAPAGFGKTTLLAQYVREVQQDPARGIAFLLDASALGLEGLGHALRKFDEDLAFQVHPLIAIDDIPLLSDEASDLLINRLREMRASGFEFVVACKPNNRTFTKMLGDSCKIGAQMLRVHPQEYAAWAEAFSISSSLDVYELTQGVPALIPLLRTAMRKRSADDLLSKASAEISSAALEDLRRVRDPLYRLVSLMILMGSGSLRELEIAGLRIRKKLCSQLARDYPLFGFDMETRVFRCLGGEGPACDGVRKEIARRRPPFVLKAVRILMKNNRVDRAVHLAELLLDAEQCIEVIAENPARLALSGNAPFVHATASRLTGEKMAQASTGVLLGLYLAALSMGEYRMARTMATELRRHAHEIEEQVSADDWQLALAFSALWGDCSGIELPCLPAKFTSGPIPRQAALLQAHRTLYRKLIGGDGNPDPSLFPEAEDGAGKNEIDLSLLLTKCDRLLDAALHGDLSAPAEADCYLQGVIDELMRRRLLPMVARARMTAAVCRILSGMPLIDERAFTDAGTVAIRESDFPTQLFCLMGEGWQSIDVGQFVNAQFRAQQVLKLADASQEFLRSWARMLDKVAFLLNTSHVTICDEAELLDLTQDVRSPIDAWLVAVHLSAAHFDSELAAWYSIHKSMLLEPRFQPIARLALTALGHRADAMRRLLPAAAAPSYLLGAELEPEKDSAAFDVVEESLFPAIVGQMNINLFGGFAAQYNGHALTSEAWKRKRACILAARLVLSLGTFVSRQTITQELWPELDFPHARENLYAVISALRTAFGQMDGGPQYLLTQGEGLALNAEFVSSDVVRFDMLAREILLKRTGTSGRQIVESCLKMEQMYSGPLYVPEYGDATFFLRMRRSYITKFIDCMLRGIEVAVELDDLPSASWLVEAALKHAPLREDVVRCAMRIYDLSGRRREVVELYNSHLHVLEHQLKAIPEEETRLLYESIISKSKVSAML